jgi:uncharacterized protein YcbK (DUF882 family)
MRIFPVFALLAILLAATGISAFAAPQGDRIIRLHNVHTKETADILYKRAGKFVPEGLERASWLLRDWRRNEATQMDPELIDLLWEIHAELGSSEPIHIISGYRSRATNDMLRKSVGGQASESRHILGQAADVYFPDVPLKKLRYSALIRERGGVGYYPTSGSPFVHVDTGRVRAWPRLPRPELALLFPDGQTQHVPSDGQSLSPGDARIARVKHQDLAEEIEAYRTSRRDPRVAELRPKQEATSKSVQVARAEPPRLKTEPTPAARPVVAARPPARVEDQDRAGLTTLAQLAAQSAPPKPRLPAPMVASLGPTLPTSLFAPERPSAPRLTATEPAASSAADTVTWVQAPAWDEDHPEELSYRPFAIAPLMSDDPAVEPAALTTLKAPEVVRTLELLDQTEAPALRLSTTRQRVPTPEALGFRGPAVAINTYFGPPSR